MISGFGQKSSTGVGYHYILSVHDTLWGCIGRTLAMCTGRPMLSTKDYLRFRKSITKSTVRISQGTRTVKFFPCIQHQLCTWFSNVLVHLHSPYLYFLSAFLDLLSIFGFCLKLNVLLIGFMLWILLTLSYSETSRLTFLPIIKCSCLPSFKCCYRHLFQNQWIHPSVLVLFSRNL